MKNVINRILIVLLSLVCVGTFVLIGYRLLSRNGSVHESQPVAVNTPDNTPPSEDIINHVHQWEEATCTEPERCSCGEERGDPLGHTCQIGPCSRCGEFVNAEAAKAIHDKIPYFTSMLNGLISYYDVLERNSEYADADMWYMYQTNSYDAFYDELRSSLKEAYDACANYPEYASLKNSLKTLINTPLYPPRAATEEEVIAAYDREQAFLSQTLFMLTIEEQILLSYDGYDW